MLDSHHPGWPASHRLSFLSPFSCSRVATLVSDRADARAAASSDSYEGNLGEHNIYQPLQLQD